MTSPSEDKRATLRQRAEARAAELAAESPERVEDLPLDEVRRRLHELRVLEILLELQQEAQGQAEVALRTMSRAVEQSPASIVITDRQGNIEYVNPRFEELTGYTKAEVLGQNPRFLRSGTTPPEVYAALWKAISEGSEWRGELCNRAKNGALFWEYAAISGLKDEAGEVGHYIAVKADITARKLAEEAQARLEAQLQQAQKMESIGRLAGGVAHDFNNMLGVILANTELAMEQLDPHDLVHADLSEIRSAALRSADLTRQLLAFARKQIIAPKILDLNDTVAGMLKMLVRLIGENIVLEVQPGASLWSVRMDPSQIDQILANLCVNARDAISGVGHLTIATGNATFDEAFCADHAGYAAGEYVRLAVIDDGCGMDPQTLAHIFEPFFTTKRVGEGTGLGLATVYGAVRQNLGFIQVATVPGEGTTFEIYLPRHAGKSEQLGRAAPSEPPVPGRETILLVEDEAAVLRVTKRMLEKAGYTVLAASNAAEAIRLAREHRGPIHLLVTDVIMPQMNGRELASTLLSMHPDLERVFMSGYTADVIAHHGVLEDGVHFLHKPFSSADLATKVRTALDGRRPR